MNGAYPAGTSSHATLGAERHGGWQGEEGSEPAGILGGIDFGSAMLDHVNEIRRLQLQMFKEHMELESQPGPDVTFGVPDGAEAYAGENAGRFKPLGEWFDAKEKGIQKLTDQLEKVCDEMKQLNSDGAQHIAASTDK